ncbi:hypothetical protein TWF696_007089 [Orbilia brochopaga]|uniref:U3 small nucleolar RNA-associated protein 22 n=1 Tax=Orbilia brochopaga TaxID=3140254 RepID=A0AAV9UUF3_9PEZI
MPTVPETGTKKRKFNELSKAHEALSARENAPHSAQHHPLSHHSETVEGFIKTRRQNRKVVDAVIDFVEDIKGLLSAIDTLSFSSLHDAERSFRSRGVYVPFAPAIGDVSERQAIVFFPPERLEVGGGLGHRFLPRNNSLPQVVDLIIGMSPSIFYIKDHLEFRYFRKRAVYLAYIASALSDQSSRYSYRFDFLDGDELRPIVLVEDPSIKSVIRLIPAIPSDLFSLSNLASSACCALLDIGVSSTQYNASIIADAYHFENTEINRNFAMSHSGFEGGLVLGSTWLSYRNYSSHLLDGGFGDNEWALLQSYTIENNNSLQPSQYSSDPFQLFMSVLKLIKNMEPSASPTNEAENPTCIRSGTVYNILFKMSRWAYTALKNDAIAALSLQQLGFSARNQFKRIFVEGEHQLQQDVDLVAIFPIETKCLLEQLPKSYITEWSLKYTISNHCYDIFSRGLGSRCKKMILSMAKEEARSLCDESNAKTRAIPQITELYAFVTLDEKTSNCDTDYGPSLENLVESAKFRDFWQEKSELRRFKDGRILETVRWDRSSSPTEQILAFLSHRIIQSSSKSIEPQYRGPDFEKLLQTEGNGSPTGTSFERVLAEFSNLVDLMRGIKDFPLGFKTVHGISPGLRFTSANPPSTYLNCPRGSESTTKPANNSKLPLEAEIELESSPGWPSDPEQRRRCELGLLIRLRNELRKTDQIAWARVGIRSPDIAKREISGFLDILTQGHYYFRLRLQDLRPNRESIIGPLATRSSGFSYPVCDSGKIRTQRDVAYRKSKQHPYFSLTIRLVKRWFQSHFLSSFFSEDMLELFGSLGFKIQPAQTYPASVVCGFTRAIIELSRWDWRKRHLEVEVQRAFSDRERASLPTEFKTRTPHSTTNDEIGLSVAVACADGSIDWFEHMVPCSVATRMTHLAREAQVKLLDASVQPLELFTPNLAFFDFLIKLLPLSIEDSKRYTNATLVEFKPDPILYHKLFCEELKLLLGRYVVIFPALDCKLIGCLWKPFQMNHSIPIPADIHITNTTGTLKGTQMPYNKATILESIRTIGAGCIEDIYMNIGQPK